MVLISKADKRKVFEHLLKEGVIVLKKDYTLEKHKETVMIPIPIMARAR